MLRELLEGGREAADDGEREVLDGPGRRLRDGGGDVHRPVAGQHDPGDAGALGGAQKRAEVAGVGDAVDDHQERWPAAGRPVARSSSSASSSGAAFASTPCGASQRASAKNLPRLTWRTGTRSASASSTMSSSTSAGSCSASSHTSRTLRRPANRSSRTAWRPSTCSPRGRGAGRRRLPPAPGARPRAAAAGARPGWATGGVGALGSDERFVPLRGGLAISRPPVTSATAKQAMPSPRPKRAEALGPLALDGDGGAHRLAEPPSCSSSRCGASFGASSTTVQSTLPGTQPAARDGGDGPAEQLEAVGPGEGGIGVGEVLADVTEPGRPEQGVGDGVGDGRRHRCGRSGRARRRRRRRRAPAAGRGRR